MKTIRKLQCLILALALELSCNALVAQEYTQTFDISKGSVVFYGDKTYSGKDPNGNTVSGTHSNTNKYRIIGSVTTTCTRKTVVDGDNVYTLIDQLANNHTITIETVNLVPGSTNQGCSYDITLDNVTIDRSQVESPLGWGYNTSTGFGNYGHSYTTLYTSTTGVQQRYASDPNCRATFNAGDDTVDVTVTLVGNNVLKGDSGPHAVLQYNRWDGGDSNHSGVVGTGSLTITGEGSLWAKKDGSHNSGAAIGSVACGGTDVSSVSSGKIVIESGIINAETGGPGDYSLVPASPIFIGHPSQIGNFASAIGGGSNCRTNDIIINGGTITAKSYASASAIGAGGGYGSAGVSNTGVITINGGNVTTYSMGMMGSIESTESGVGIGAGSACLNSGGNAQIAIYGGTINVWKYDYDNGEYVYGNIGGGSSNISKLNPISGGTGVTGNGGFANVEVYGGTVYAGNLGGGSASHANAIGGDAHLSIDMTEGELHLSGNIGGGNSVYSHGGNAVVNIIKGNVYAGSIGGGNSIGDETETPPVPGDGNGGDASVNVSGGTFVINGKIGGGYSNGAGAGGNASIYVTGGTLDCASIGGGDSNLGLPGTVSADVDPATNPLGAGVYIAGSNKITVKSGTIGGGTNTAGDIGKATAYINATHSESSIQGQFILSNTTSTATDHCFFIMEAGAFDNTDLGTGKYLRAKDEGGAVYMNDDNGEIEIKGGTISNSQGTLGGAIYMSNGSFTMSGGTVGADASGDGNKATEKGGAVYMAGGSFNMTGGSIKCNTTSADGYGAGLYLNNGTATLSGGAISGNEAENGYGGGIYINGGTCTLSDGATVGGATAADGNEARHGGGIYSAGGSITVKGGNIAYNKATDGGGIYSNGPTATVTIIKEGTTPSLLEYNQAVRGGGIFANRGVVDFTDGQVRQNYASEAGGGMYVNTEGTLNLKGNATLSGNHVPATGKGGGVYLDGTLNVGENADDPTDRHSLKVDDNYAGTPSTPNNVYLHDTDDVVTLLSDISGKDSGGNYHSHIGFSVDMGFRPVIYAATANIEWLSLLMGTGSALAGAIFDDSQRYIAIHLDVDSGPFENEYIYLWACWTTAVTSDPGTSAIEMVGDTCRIRSKEGLAWFISLVNGLNHRVDGEGHTEAGSNPFTEAKPTLNGVLEADVDMREFLWVPIGGVGSYIPFDPEHPEQIISSIFTPGGSYEGTFDGRGHTISGLDCRYITAIDSYGLFGNLKEAASVSNTFVKDYYFEAQDNSITYNIGGIAGTMEGNASIANCEAKGTVTATRCGTVSTVGGLVGKMDGMSEIHSSIGIPDVAAGAAARHVGGIAGEVLASDNAIRNSFANASFGATADTVGGLVGKNSGLVENCYAHLRGNKPNNDNFGYLVGDNEGGTVRYSYAPQPTSQYTVTGKEGTLEGVGTYGETRLPYLYKHRDTQVDANNEYVSTEANADNQMMKVLNRWVDTINSKQSAITYTKWGRPWQKGDEAKPINDDLPVLRMPIANAVASSQGDPYLDYSDIDRLLNNYHASGDAIWMYASDTLVTGSTGSGDLYIAEDVALKHTGTLDAYVCVTLDNSAGVGGAHPTYGAAVGVTTDATDWHLFSTPLMNAPLGIDYGTDGNTPYGFSFGHPDDMPYYRFHQGERHGYFPSHRYGTEYPATDANLTDAANAGNYYKEWDFYAYSEPDYHWINFKRNRASHHHYDTEGHDPIAYDNESKLVRGKGYFVATREETMLQCHDTLNNGAVETTYNLTQTSGVPRHGYNLLGNPYQAYLDFDLFAEVNSGDDDAIWADVSDASYTILDEDPVKVNGNDTVVAYRTYSYRATDDNPWVAGRFIHPHQGFFVRLSDNAEATAYFYGDMRNASDTVSSKFRSGERPRYPLVNLVAAESNGMADVVTVELGRPDKGGAPVMRSLRTGNGKLWCSYEGRDYAIAFTQPGVSEAAIRFETVAEAEYTMTWDTHNGEFGYLHLIDNKTGADIDCLTTGEYKFTASPSDYTSRFRLVFDYTGVEEGEGDTPAGPSTFAFMMGDELVVTGEGVLQAFDVTGRMVLSRELRGVQTTVPLPEASSGVYVLRLTNGSRSQVQKMVISK